MYNYSSDGLYPVEDVVICEISRKTGISKYNNWECLCGVMEKWYTAGVLFIFIKFTRNASVKSNSVTFQISAVRILLLSKVL